MEEKNVKMEEELKTAGVEEEEVKVDEVLEEEDLFASENGLLRVDGTVFVGSIQRRGVNMVTKDGRTKKASNVVKAIGYKITNVKTGQSIFMEKLEAIDLVTKLGAVNATVRPRRHVDKDEEGNPIATTYSLNLQPIKGERPFTDGDRLYPVFKLDKNGKVKKPAELAIKKEECTELLWKMIEKLYKNRKPKGNSKTYRRLSNEERLERIKQAMQVANFKGAVNPFEEK